jgi:dienelactone hydrolase
MAKKIIIALLTVAMIATYAIAIERVSFKGTDKDKNGSALELRGRLIKPDGNGPFPAVVLLHECVGISLDVEGAFAEKLSSWGYVTFQIDSFIPRAIGDSCADFGIIPPNTRVLDVYDAKSYLSRLPYVDRNRIAIVGWGHGGATALCAVSRANFDANASTYKSSPANRIIDEKTFSSYSPFQAAVAFYPLCTVGFGDSTAPLLILTGELDTFTPANLCMKNMPSGKSSKEIILKVYPKAAHGFVNPNVNDSFKGHKIAYQPEAAADADVQLKMFLAKHLK